VARKTLSDLGVRALKPRAARFAYPDPELAGRYIRLQPAGAKSYCAVAMAGMGAASGPLTLNQRAHRRERRWRKDFCDFAPGKFGHESNPLRTNRGRVEYLGGKRSERARAPPPHSFGEFWRHNRGSHVTCFELQARRPAFGRGLYRTLQYLRR
jgi:hypothetical protein